MTNNIVKLDVALMIRTDNTRASMKKKVAKRETESVLDAKSSLQGRILIPRFGNIRIS